jgi:hypothetical protein
MKSFTYLILTIAITSCSNQKKLPVLSTTSKTISIKEGNLLHKNVWAISSEVEFDEFVTNKFSEEKSVSFISNIDTLTFIVTPNNTYDFVIQHNNEKASTRINTDTLKEASIQSEDYLESSYDNENRKSLTDTIPFTLGSDHGIHLKGKINKSDTLDFLFDIGANAIVITSNLIGNKVNLELDGKAENKGSDGLHNIEKSSSNEIEIGTLNWTNVEIISIDYQNPNFDGVLGWIAFENKIVEINYDKNILIIHKSIETTPKDYFKIETIMIEGLLFIKGNTLVNGTVSEGWFEYDSGSNGCLSLSQNFATENNLNGAMEKVGESISSGSAGIEWKAHNYILPKLQFGEFELLEIPISINEKDPEGIENNDILGNNLLKRFNAIIDLKNFQIYLRPNTLLNLEY